MSSDIQPQEIRTNQCCMKSDRRFLIFYFLLFAFALAPLSASALVPNDPFFREQWYLDKIGAPAAWDVAMGNPKSIVAVLDVGVDLDHPDLRDAIWTNPGEMAGNGVDDDGNGFIDDVHGWDFVGNDNDPSPSYDVAGADPRDLHHGTLVSGIIAARGNNAEGIAGIDWSAKIMPLRVLAGDGSGDVEDVVAALDYAVREGATVVNLSFVGEQQSFRLDEAIADTVRHGVLVVAAGGNEDKTGRGDLDVYPAYPICSGDRGAEVLGVAATNRSDAKASFSSYGSCVDIAAPGERIASTLFHDPGHVIIAIGSRVTSSTFDQPYGGYFSGTSFAAPIAAGAASLLRGVMPSAAPADVIALLRSTADPITNGDTAVLNKLGTGRLNLARAIEEATARIAAVPSASASRITVAKPLASLGEEVELRVELRSATGRPIAGRSVTIRPSRVSDRAEPAVLTVDSVGVAVAHLRSSAEGLGEFSVEVDGVPFGTVRVVFVRALAAPIGSGSLLRGSAPAVYVIGSDGKRYVFPDNQTFRSWYADAGSVQRVPDAVLAAFPLGGLIIIRPGTFLVKITTDPKVYAVELPTPRSGQGGGHLRWVSDETTARVLYGDNWAKRVVDVPDGFFVAYSVGQSLTAAAYPDGTLLEDARDNERYLIEGGQRRHFASTLAFLQNGFQWRDIIEVPAVGYPDGTMIAEREAVIASPIQ
ncbi:MAG: S8 family peptidase [Candidatus Uhrbacteria bacterium]